MNASKYAVPVGRVLFVLIFLFGGVSNFSKGSVAYAASAGVPMANILVPLSGIIAILGSLLILFGYRAKLGAWLIVLFLVPVTLAMHAYWKAPPAAYGIQQIMFMKNVAMLGCALMLTYFGSGPCSLDNCIGKCGKNESEKGEQKAG